MVRKVFIRQDCQPSTNIQKNVARWKYLENIKETHQENSTLEDEFWILCITAVMIQQVFVRMNVRKRLEWILLRKHLISLVNY